METKDSLWKEAIEKYFKEFLFLFFPLIGEDIDFDKGYEFLNKELQKIVRGGKDRQAPCGHISKGIP